MYFNPRSPCGERHGGAVHGDGSCLISTHAPRAGSDARVRRVRAGLPISTHAPRAGSDLSHDRTGEPVPISTHAPRAGSDPPSLGSRTNTAYFNPRSPCGERPRPSCPLLGSESISTHAPRAGSDFPQRATRRRTRRISTHAPRAGSDLPAKRVIWHGVFQPTLPVRGATHVYADLARLVPISTHAPRAGSDPCLC